MEKSLVPSGTKAIVVSMDERIVPFYRRSISVPHSHRFSLRETFGQEITTLFDEESPLADENKRQKYRHKGKKVPACTITKESLSVILSALYCKFLVLLGLAFPVTQVISQAIPESLYSGFYIYLYSLSLIFILSLHIIQVKSALINKFLRPLGLYSSSKSLQEEDHKNDRTINNYGSFYLRLGAAGFGIGSMVFCGLEFGEYFLSTDEPDCKNIIRAITPALRMLFTVLQLHFIFLSETSMDTLKNQVILRFSLAHMLATNLCEWLSVIVEETKHDLEPHFHHHHRRSFYTNDTRSEENNGTRLLDMRDCLGGKDGLLIQEASSYLFPCTIEYSLICAITLVEMWREVRIESKKTRQSKQSKHRHRKGCHRSQSKKDEYSVDCSHSHQGLLLGLLTTVYTVISLVVFFTLRTRPDHEQTASMVVTICENFIHVASVLAMLIAVLQMRHMAYCVHRLNAKGSMKLGLDIALLLKAQAGIYMYNMFSALACLLTPGAAVWPDIFSLIQTTAQTIFILDAWWKRSRTPEEQEKKPGREMLTYLRMANMALWIIGITEKNKAQLRPVQLNFFGPLTWTVITHVSMPLAIFYRFHSAICFFEIWRNAYKSVTDPVRPQPIFI